MMLYDNSTCYKRFFVFFFVLNWLMLCFGQKNNDSIAIQYIDKRIIVHPIINDSLIGIFFVDTGSPHTLLDSISLPKTNFFVLKSWSKKIKGSESGEKMYYLMTQKQGRDYLVQNIKMELDSIEFLMPNPLAGNLTLFGIDGILSLKDFAQKEQIVVVEIKNKQIILTKDILREYNKIPFIVEKYSKAPIVDLSIKVKTPTKTITHSGKFMIDTGLRSGIILSDKLMSLYPDSLLNESFFLSDTKGNVSVIKYVNNIPVSINNQKDMGLRMNFSKQLDTNIISAIGMQFLENFLFAFDYQKQKFYYSQIAEEKYCKENYINLLDVYGLGINWMMYLNKTSDYIFVSYLDKDKEADRLGIKIKNIILKINGENICQQSDSELIRHFENIQSITVQSDNGDIYVLE